MKLPPRGEIASKHIHDEYAAPIAARPLVAHGIIGDQGTAALIADDGTIDFLCWPAFNSPTIFASLLDTARGGSWQIAPVLESPRTRQMYLPDTNVLLTTFSSPDGVAEIVDFMPFPALPGEGPKLIRRLQAVRGNIRSCMRCAPRFDYARAGARAKTDGRGGITFYAEEGIVRPLRLVGAVPIRIDFGTEGDTAVANFVLRAGEATAFTLLEENDPVPDSAEADRLFNACIARWQAWTAQMDYRGRWREIVTRSALLLKLMTSRVHGSVIAAVTFGLPEVADGSRNWDYRATWIRDASFTIYAFMRLGYVEEANAFMRWVAARAKGCGSDGSMQVIYTLEGKKLSDEIELSHLSGYGGAVPVRIGNQARAQLQLDIYGELLDAVYLANKYGEAISHDSWGSHRPNGGLCARPLAGA